MTILYLSAEQHNILNVFNKIQVFSDLGGYKINHSKSEILLFNCSDQVLPLDMRNQVSFTGAIRYLGIYVSHDPSHLYQLNYESALTKATSLLKQW